MTIGAALDEYFSEQARERQEATRAKPGEQAHKRQGGGNFPPPTDKGKTRDKVGEAVGMSGLPPQASQKALKGAILWHWVDLYCQVRPQRTPGHEKAHGPQKNALFSHYSPRSLRLTVDAET